MITKKSQYTLLAFAVGFFPLGQVADAATTTYPGSMCQATDGSTLTIDGNSHLENQLAGAKTVHCPVIGDPLVLSGSANPFVTDQHFTEDVCCSARAKNTGSSVWFSSDVCSAGTNSDAQKLNITPPDVNYTYTHRFYQCTIPGVYMGVRSEIRTYRY